MNKTWYARGDEVLCDFGDRAYTVATVADWSEDTVAHAQLIASAPGLLNKLQTILDHWHGGHLQVRPEAEGSWLAAVQDGEEAIARAKGE